MRDFISRALANLAWAFATIGQKDEQLFAALAGAAVQRVGDFNSQELANTAWSFAMVGHRNRWLFTAVTAATQQHMRDFNLQHLTNTVWALSSCDNLANSWASSFS